MISAVAIGGYILAAAALLMAFVLWKKSEQLHGILGESIARNDAFEVSHAEARARIGELEDALDKRQKSTARLEKAVEDYKNRTEELERKLSDNLRAFDGELERERGQTERFKDEMKAVMQQLVESDQELKQLRQSIETKVGAEKNRQDRDIAQARIQITELAEKLKSKEGEVKRLTTVLDKVDPKETARVKRKNRQYAQLFTIMRGQKEMAEELAKNWETALRQTSGWILRSRNPKRPLPDRLGMLVGTALEIIGGQLVDESQPGAVDHAEGHESEPPDLDALIAKNTTPPGEPFAQVPAANTFAPGANSPGATGEIG